MSRETQKLWSVLSWCATAIAIPAIAWLFWATYQNSVAIAKGEARDAAIMDHLATNARIEREHYEYQNKATSELTKSFNELANGFYELRGAFGALNLAPSE